MIPYARIGCDRIDKMTSAPPRLSLPDGTKLPTLSSAGYQVLHLLHKGRIFQAHGTWRFRGSRSPTSKQTLFALLAHGLAEHVENDPHTQIQITAAGRSVDRQSPRCEVATSTQSGLFVRLRSLREVQRTDVAGPDAAPQTVPRARLRRKQQDWDLSGQTSRR